MAKILALVLGLAVVMWVAKHVIEGQVRSAQGAGQASAPKQQLDNVRQKAKAIEDQAQENVKEALRKSGGQ
jgi:hypothetical protein